MKCAFLTAILASLLLSGCFVTDGFNWVKEKIADGTEMQKMTLKTQSGELNLTVEIVDNEEERQKGLMERKELPANTGMWFVFEGEAPRVFWMKNTLIPLDVIFFNAKKEAVDIIENMKPCTVAQCPRYPSAIPAMFALEVPAGYVQAQKIKVGDTADL